MLAMRVGHFARYLGHLLSSILALPTTHYGMEWPHQDHAAPFPFGYPASFPVPYVAMSNHQVTFALHHVYNTVVKNVITPQHPAVTLSATNDWP